MPSGWTLHAARRMAEAPAPLLAVRGLSIGYRDSLGRLSLAVQDLSFTLAPGAALGIVGESGSGKSTAARALLGYFRGASERTAGEIQLAGRRIDGASARELAALRGIQAAFVPQNPLSSLTYHLRVGAQLVEILRTRAGLDRLAARRRAIELFAATQLPEPERIFERYPHQLSGGQRQRVVIACALACKPRMLVLDEPTTALDKTTEAQVLELVRELRRELGAGLVLVTHDLNAVASLCDHVLVMKEGRVVEQGATATTFAQPRTAYTRSLVSSVLRLDVAPGGGMPSIPSAAPAVLNVQALGHRYRRSAWFERSAREGKPALAEVSLELRPGEIVGVIGESGSGKTTLGAAIAGLVAPSDGRLHFRSEPLAPSGAQRTHEQRRRIQIIFQDPLSSLNPRQRVGTAVARPIEVFFGVGATEARRRAAALLAELGLGEEYLERFPRQLSGGQQQRVAIARAFAAEPDLIVCDEVTSALDATIQSQVLDSLREMQVKRGVAMLVITHDLAVVWRLARRVLVLHQGRVHEQGETAQVFAAPRSAYTRALLQASTSTARLTQRHTAADVDAAIQEM
ncbi:MAG: ABC transporter ATP-binding protein [Rubrivivax sp.]|nr:ABC transporter ATP-binding protein [Rubrivivax sp.]